MKIHILAENLQKKISFLNRGISSKSQLPILLNFLIEARDGKVLINSTDLEIGIQIQIPANIEEEGSITVPAKIFSDLIQSLSSEKITISTKDSTLEVKTSKTKSTFQTTPKEEFPNLYEEKGEEIARIKKNIIEKDFMKVLFAASIDMARPALSGILIKKDPSIENQFLFVATDGYRLSLKQNYLSSALENKEILEKPLLVPARVLKEVVMMKDESGDIGMYVSAKSNQILFQSESTILVGRLLEAEFPKYEKIIPANYSTKVFFDREDLQKAVKTCSIFARETANIIKLSLTKESITVSANSPSVGENTVEVEAKIEGDESEIAFNSRYLLDLFSNIEENEMVFEMSGPLSPGVFKIKGDASFLHLIMPIRVQE